MSSPCPVVPPPSTSAPVVSGPAGLLAQRESVVTVKKRLKKKTACILLQYPTVLSICPTVPCRVPCSILHYLKLSP